MAGSAGRNAMYCFLVCYTFPLRALISVQVRIPNFQINLPVTIVIPPGTANRPYAAVVFCLGLVLFNLMPIIFVPSELFRVLAYFGSQVTARSSLP
jgi:hypothetical protein